jgi:transposase
VHDRVERRVRDVPVFEVPVELIIPRLRLSCRTCGPKLERLEWLAPYARVTTRMASSVARLCKVMSLRHVAQFYRLSWTAVKRIDQRHLERELGAIDLSGVTVIAMDEFAIQNGHRYATVIVEPSSKRVLWVGRGRSREDIRPFFELLGPTGCARLRTAVMDMNTAYDLEVRMHCPQAEVVYDLFHVVAKYGREVIDRVRVDEANRLRGDRVARKVIKSSRWLLLRNLENVTREADQIRLEEILAANQALMTVYILKDDLKALWDYRHPGYAKRFWQDWYRRAMSSGIGPLCQFARRLRTYLPGILAHASWPLGRAFYASERLTARLQDAPTEASDIERFPAIVDSEDSVWEFYRNETEFCRIAPRVALRTPDEAMRIQAAIDGLGVARLPVTVAQGYVD